MPRTTDGAAGRVAGKTAADESFPVAWLLPPTARPAVHAYYAFARTADDVADAPDIAPADKLAQLDALGANVRSGSGAPVAVRLHHVLTARGLPLSLATDLLEAFRADARGMACADWPALMAYCDASAVPVGRFLLALFGEHRPAALQASDALCRALQVLNHVQDCGKDMRALDRCYLPADWLAAEDLQPDCLIRATTSDRLRRVLDRTLAGCDALLAEASPLPGRIAARGLRAQGAATLSVAHALRRRLAAGDPLAGAIRPGRLDWGRALAAGLVWGARP